MNGTNPKVDWYFEKEDHISGQSGKWIPEIKKLRTIAFDCGLNEELKWGCPSYTLQGTNIVLIHVFKEYCAFLFFKGAVLKDPHHILIQQTENVQAARQIRFTSVQEIEKMKTVLNEYIFEAIEVEKAGVKVPMKKTKEFNMPEEFQKQLDEKPALKTAFEALTPGRQRGYMLYFSSAKQAKTREERVQKYIPQILSGKGLED